MFVQFEFESCDELERRTTDKVRNPVVFLFETVRANVVRPVVMEMDDINDDGRWTGSKLSITKTVTAELRKHTSPR